MKRKVSLLLAFVMILSLVPMSVFASTANEVNKVPTVADNHKFTTDAPEVRIEENNVGDFDTTTAFTVNVENAKWNSATDTNTIVDAAFFKDENGTETSTGIKTTRRTDSEIDVVVTALPTAPSGKLSIVIPVLAEVNGAGEVKVEIESDGSVVSSQTLTVAVAADGDTVTTIEDTVEITEAGTKIETIKIEETSVGAMYKDASGYTIELKLPSDYKWVDDNGATDNVEVAGGFDSADITSAQVSATDDNIYEITGKFQSAGARGKLYIAGLKVVPTSDADVDEDVTVRVSAKKVATTTLTVGTYVEYGVTVAVDADDSMKEVVAGKLVGTTDEAHELVTLVIEENALNAWLLQRKTEIEFPEWVRVIGVDVESTGLDTNDVEVADVLGWRNDDANVLEFSGISRDGSGDKAKLELTFYVSVQADKTGDITAEVSGRSLTEDAELVLGKAVAAVTVKADAENVKLGYQDEAIGQIVLTETEEGRMEDNSIVTVVLADGFKWNDEPKVEVTKGDLEIDQDSVDVTDETLTFDVKDESTEASEITISGGTVDLNRILPEGDFTADVKVLVKNGKSTLATGDEKLGYFTKTNNASVVFARVITPADDNTQAGTEVKFVIGDADYKVGDEVKTADVAPYIKDGRTMLSVRYVAEAMGVSDNNILWDGTTRTVTIFKGDRVAQMTIGSNVLYVNGTAINMDTVAEIKDGRTMLPVSFVAKALGADVAWDAATRTVTVK